MNRILVLSFSCAAVALALGALPACEGVDSTARIDPSIGAPSGEAFRPVSAVLVNRCGSIDCHGSKYRNMRLVGSGSTRLDPNHRPDAPETTQAEVDQNYEAVLALEPDVVREVLAARGANADRLTFIRKARHAESHKGGQRIAPGDDADACVLSWLAGTVDTSRCEAALPSP